MNPIDTKLMLPYLGTDSNNEVFQYLLIKITQRSALIGIPDWLVNHTHYSHPENLNLHLNRFTINFNSQTTDIKGFSSPIESPDASYGHLYKVEFEKPLQGHILFRRNTFEDLSPKERKEHILWSIYDSFLLKKGINVYLKHLIPFLSRILQVSEKNYDALKTEIFFKLHRQVKAKCEVLEFVYETLKEEEGDFCELNLEHLRELIQSEIDVVLMQLAIEGPEKIKAKQARLKGITPYTITSYEAYLNSIKTLESRLYANFNCLTALYSSQGKLVKV